MDIAKLKLRAHKIYDDMIDAGYKHEKAINISNCAKQLIEVYDAGLVSDYEDYFFFLLSKTKCILPNTRVYHKRRLSFIFSYIEEDRFPSVERHTSFMRERVGCYVFLTSYYKSVVDKLKTLLNRNKCSKEYFDTCVSILSNFLKHLQENQCFNFDSVTADIVQSFFYDGSKHIRSANYRNYLLNILTSIQDDFSGLLRVISFLPELRVQKKNREYLSDNELKKLKAVIGEKSDKLTYRDKAILTLAMYTGFRGCDIVNLKYENIDWERDVIQLVQSKTGNPIIIPMRPIVGNALFDYITKERPINSNSNVFLAYGREVRPLNKGSIRNILVRAMSKCGVRTDKGQRGFHLLRHNLASTLLKNEVSTAVISDTLGHSTIESTNIYLSSDMSHLKNFALSIEQFPIRKEVFKI